MDKLEEYQRELEDAKTRIGEVSVAIALSAVAMLDAQSNYEEAKNITLLALYDEEVRDKFKRTEAQRTAIYRHENSELRRIFYRAKADHEGNIALQRGVLAKMTALQSLLGLEKEKAKLGFGNGP